MQNFFSFVGFAFTAMLCGALFFILVGRERGQSLTSALSGGDRTENNLDLPEPEAMTPIASEGPRRSKSGRAAKSERTSRGAEAPAIEQDETVSESDFKQLYGDVAFVQKTARTWKDRVAEAAEVHNVRPQALLAHVIVQSFIDRGYGERQFRRDLGAHAGDRVMSYSAAVQRYPYGWSVNHLATKYDLGQYFTAKSSPNIVIASSAAPAKTAAPRRAAATSPAREERRLATQSPRESTLRDVVAQQYGFKTWSDLQQRARPAVRAQAEKKVAGMKPAMMIR